MAAGVGSATGECNRPVDLVRVIGSVANHSSLLEPPDASAITKGLASSGTAQNAKQSPMTFAIGRWAPSRRRIFRSRTSGSAALLALVVEAVSQTNGIGAKQQRLGEPPETDASGELLRASVGSARLICFDADTCSWRSITNNFRSVTFVKRPPSAPVVSLRPSRACAAPGGAAADGQVARPPEVV